MTQAYTYPEPVVVINDTRARTFKFFVEMWQQKIAETRTLQTCLPPELATELATKYPAPYRAALRRRGIVNRELRNAQDIAGDILSRKRYPAQMRLLGAVQAEISALPLIQMYHRNTRQIYKELRSELQRGREGEGAMSLLQQQFAHTLAQLRQNAEVGRGDQIIAGYHQFRTDFAVDSVLYLMPEIWQGCDWINSHDGVKRGYGPWHDPRQQFFGDFDRARLPRPAYGRGEMYGDRHAVSGFINDMEGLPRYNYNVATVDTMKPVPEIESIDYDNYTVTLVRAKGQDWETRYTFRFFSAGQGDNWKHAVTHPGPEVNPSRSLKPTVDPHDRHCAILIEMEGWKAHPTQNMFEEEGAFWRGPYNSPYAAPELIDIALETAELCGIGLERGAGILPITAIREFETGKIPGALLRRIILPPKEYWRALGEIRITDNGYFLIDPKTGRVNNLKDKGGLASAKIQAMDDKVLAWPFAPHINPVALLEANAIPPEELGDVSHNKGPDFNSFGDLFGGV